MAIFPATCITASAQAQSFETPPPEIVSAWKLTGGNVVLVFGYDGTYYQIQGDAADPGMERGSFTWDKETQAFSANTIVDTNGEGGLSHPTGATSVSIAGAGNNTLSLTVAGEGTFTFSRIINGSTPSTAIVGSWAISGEKFSVTFLADNTYYLTEETNDVPFGYTGMEKGTYTWNSTTKALTASAAIDTNGDVGINGITSGVTVNITGNSLVFFDGVESTTLTRITTNPTPARLPDFGVARFANYIQISNSTPALRTFDGVNAIYPYSADAFVDPAVGATDPTVKIGSGALIAIPEDDPGSFSIESGFASLTALNTYLPNSTAVQFKSGAATANLTTIASQTFPSIPKIIVRDGASWSGSVYSFGDDEVLQWTLPAGFVASQYVTTIEIYDPVADEDILNAELHGDVTFLDLGGKLNPDDEYEVELEFYRIDNSTTAGTGVFVGRQGYVLAASSTTFNVRSRDSFPVAPTIAEQPVSQPGTPGSPLSLTVGINESAFLTASFQWFKDNEEIIGQTGNSLFIPNYSNAADAGTYAVEVTNSAGSVTSTPATLGPPTVKSITLSKDIEYIQTGASTVIVNPEGITATHGGTYGFFTEVKGTNMVLITVPTVTPPVGTLLFQNTLHYNAGDLLWGYGLNGSEFNTDTQALIDSKFPNGTYTFLVNGVSVPLSLPGNSFYPNTPQLTLSGGTWVNGKYAMDAANPLTVTTNVFSQYGSNADAHINLLINDLETSSLASSQPTSSSATLTAPSFTLPTDQITEIEANFDAIVSKSTVLSGALATAYYTKSLFMFVYILPKISSQTASQIVVGGGSLMLQVTATGTPLTDPVTGIPLPPTGMNYQWSKDGVDIPGLASSSFGMPNFMSDDAGTYTCTVSNDVGSVTSAPIYLEFADAFQSYAASYGLNSITTGAPDADFDKDGVPNLLEFLFGGNPTLPNSGLLPTITKAPGSSNLVFTYKRKLAATGVTQVIEHAANLSPPWTSAVHGQNGVTIATAAVPGDATSEQITVTIPTTNTSRFVRLKASR